MQIEILELLQGAKKAKGLTVIIDVFRAFSVMARENAPRSKNVVHCINQQYISHKKPFNHSG